MAYAFRRQNKGNPSFTGMYMGPDGNRRSAGTFGSRRAALRAAQREEQLVLEGRWRDRRLGEMPFADFWRTSGFPASTSSSPPAPGTGTTSTNTPCRSSVAGRWPGS